MKAEIITQRHTAAISNQVDTKCNKLCLSHSAVSSPHPPTNNGLFSFLSQNQNQPEKKSEYSSPASKLRCAAVFRFLECTLTISTSKNLSDTGYLLLCAACMEQHVSRTHFSSVRVDCVSHLQITFTLVEEFCIMNLCFFLSFTTEK